MLKILFIILGTISLTLGVIGISVPGLPTTPFLLLTATLYCKSSEGLYRWFMGHRIWGKLIKEYREKNAISLKTKIYSIILMWAMISISVFCFIQNFVIQFFVFVTGLVGTFFMGRINTYKDE